MKRGLSAKLLLNNKGPRPLEVKPTLFSMTGERFDVEAVVVEPRSFRIVDMRDWVEAAGEGFEEGSIQVFHLGRDLVLGAQIQLEDKEHSLAFEEKLVELTSFKSSRLDGLWWLPSRKGDVLLAVSNTSDAPVSATINADGETPRRHIQRTVDLLPHETRLLNLQDDLVGEVRSMGQERAAMPRFGAISVEHTGPKGAVIARGMAQDVERGYSLAIQFLDPGSARSTKWQGAGLRLSQAGGETLQAIVVAHNSGEEETTVSGRVPYTAKDGGVVEAELPDLRLLPHETKIIDISKTLKLGKGETASSSASLEFEHTGRPGSVSCLAFSVSEGGNQLFRVPMWDIAGQRSSTGGYPWRIEGDSSTTVYIKNTADHEQQFFMTLTIPGGAYSIGTKKIAAHQTMTFDLRRMRDEQVPDAKGQVIPPDAQGGQLHWSKVGPEGGTIIGRSEQSDLRLGMSSNYACLNCCNDNPLNPRITPQAPKAWLMTPISSQPCVI